MTTRNPRRGARMRSWAENNGLTTETIAVKLSVTEQTVRNWFAGETEPRASQAVVLDSMGVGFLRLVYFFGRNRAA